jgi:hypothetical protein
MRRGDNKMEKLILDVDAAINNLQELGFQINEMKQKGLDIVPLKSYESLLDWAIDGINFMKDFYEKDRSQSKIKNKSYEEFKGEYYGT